MNPSDARRNEALEWLAKAAEDLASARVLIDAGHPGTALFHCQQSAEKCLKGFLTWGQNHAWHPQGKQAEGQYVFCWTCAGMGRFLGSE